VQALISKIEPRENGYRVAQVVAEGNTFDVTPDFMWVSCDDSIIADKFWYDIDNEEFNLIPVHEQTPMDTPQ